LRPVPQFILKKTETFLSCTHFFTREVRVDLKDHHGTEEQIERYLLGNLSGLELAALEEHLLICESCRERTESAEAFAMAMRDALNLDAQSPQPVATRMNWLAWPGRPAFQLAAAFVVILAALAIFWGRGSGLPAVANLQLTATRGEMPSVKPARELDLALTGAPSDGGPFRVELVNAQGRKVWDSLADSEGDAVLVKVSSRLQPGDYFVRLYAADGPMLHEYGFRVDN
jgi:hypothetical protein